MVERRVKSVCWTVSRRFKAQHQESADVPRESSERSMKGVLASRAWRQGRAGLFKSELESRGCRMFQEEVKSAASRAFWKAQEKLKRGACWKF